MPRCPVVRSEAKFRSVTFSRSDLLNGEMDNTSSAWLYPLAFAANATRQAGNRTWITCGGVNTHPRSCEALLGHGRGTSHCSWLTHPTPPILRGTTWPFRTPYSTRAAHSLWEAEIMGPLPSCTHSPRLPHFSHTSGSCYKTVWDKEFPELKESRRLHPQHLLRPHPCKPSWRRSRQLRGRCLQHAKLRQHRVDGFCADRCVRCFLCLKPFRPQLTP